LIQRRNEPMNQSLQFIAHRSAFILSSMSRRRFYAPRDAFDAQVEGARVRLAPEEARHLRDVLRLKAGDEAFVFDGEGGEYRCVVAEGEGGGRRGALALEVRERVEPLRPESPLRLTLGVALLKGEKFDLVVQKATELGVGRIVPVVTKRADVRLHEVGDGAKRVGRWQRLALEAAKQSGRARVPIVDAPLAFRSVVAAFAVEASAGARMLFAERSGRGLNEAIEELRGARPNSVIALVGSEGGWEDEELSAAADAGWSIVTLGGRTLRAETAAIAVAVLLQHRFGDLL
jgi:16S rRNA (uracil1498-N3)-methyltransferase